MWCNSIHKNDIECIRRNYLEHDITEAIWLEIKLKLKKIILAFIYRPPNEHTISSKTWSNYMDDAISSAYAEDKNIINLGDFNIDLLGKHPHQETGSSVIEKYELYLLITNYTRVTPTKQSLLDHIYVSDTSLVKYSDVLPWALNDHFSVM